MPRRPQQQGSKSPFDLRVGTEAIPKFRGGNKQVDPGSIPADQFEHLENARINNAIGGSIKPRSGLSKATSTQVSSIEGIYDASDIGAPAGESDASVTSCGQDGIGQAVQSRLYASSSSAAVAMYDQVNGTRLDDGSIPLASNNGVCLDLALRRVLIPDYANGGPGTTFATMTSQNSGVYALPPNSNKVALVFTPTLPAGRTKSSLQTVARVKRGVFLIGRISSGAGPIYEADIVEWNGISTTGGTLFSLATNTPGVGLVGNPIVFALDEIGYCFTGLGTTITGFYRRTSRGVWAAITLPVASMTLTEAVIYAGDLYLVGKDNAVANGYILKLRPGATATTTDHTAANFYPHSCIVHNGILYYISDRTGGSGFWVGSFDGTTYNDALRDLGATFNTWQFLGAFQGEIYLLSAVGGANTLYRTRNGGDLTGTLDLVSTCFVSGNYGGFAGGEM